MNKPNGEPLGAEELVTLAPFSLNERGRLEATFRFASFVEAFAFMSASALVAEKLDHHPDWRNVYRTVEVELWTHDRGAVTGLDAALAREMTRLARAFGAE
jgi:4a-hydroxytetrahydrobiopterin dehydratase